MLFLTALQTPLTSLNFLVVLPNGYNRLFTLNRRFFYARGK